MSQHATSAVQIVAHELYVDYGEVRALAVPKLSVSGRVIALLGHNGAGKSTFLKALLELLPLRTGSIAAFDGNGGRRLVPERDLAFCPENGAVFADIPVESYIRLWCRMKKHDANYYRRAGARYIELFEVDTLLRRRGRELSKGQRRRVQSAIGFLTDPRLFLFDEPFDGLDVQRTSELASIVQEEATQRAFVVSSHRMDVVERIADQAIVLANGTLVAAGPMADVVKQLCPHKFVVTNGSAPPALTVSVRQRLPGAHVSHVGEALVIVGTALEEAVVGRVCAELLGGVLQIQRATPSLIDAMNLHLQQLRDRAVLGSGAGGRR